MMFSYGIVVGPIWSAMLYVCVCVCLSVRELWRHLANVFAYDTITFGRQLLLTVRALGLRTTTIP